MDKYEQLKALEELRERGAISEEEFRYEKNKILSISSTQDMFGLDQNTYLTFMHLSQFAGFILPRLGFAIPIVMWLANSNNNQEVNRHGKNIANFMLSMFIYFSISLILILLLIGIPMLIALAAMEIIFIIVAAVKANQGEYWKYPLSIPFFT